MRLAGLFRVAIKTNDFAATRFSCREVMGLVEAPEARRYRAGSSFFDAQPYKALAAR
jgi:hypothetical protein